MPLRLQHFLNLRIAAVTLACLLVFSGWAALQAVRQIHDEGRGAGQLHQLTADLLRLQTARPEELPEVLNRIRTLAGSGALRHMSFEFLDMQGGSLVRAAPLAAGDPVTLALARWLGERSAPQAGESIAFEIERIDGRRWQVRLATSALSEQQEAAAQMLTLLTMLVALALALALGVMLATRRALRPVRAILQGLDRLARGDYGARLSRSPIIEIDGITQAVNQLAAALQSLEETRRSLSLQLLTLQEDERARLAQELHDELGQRLTAIQLNAAYLARGAALGDEARAALDDLVEASAATQQEVRELLKRLRPRASEAPLDAAEFARLVRHLVDGWSQLPGQETQYLLELEVGGVELDPPVWLALYRMTQEALTNVARHAGASRVRVTLRADGACVDWRVEDDGVGIAELSRAMLAGNGLAGLQQRVWSLGAVLEIDGAPPGLRLRARVPLAPPTGAGDFSPPARSGGATLSDPGTPAA